MKLESVNENTLLISLGDEISDRGLAQQWAQRLHFLGFSQ